MYVFVVATLFFSDSVGKLDGPEFTVHVVCGAKCNAAAICSVASVTGSVTHPLMLISLDDILCWPDGSNIPNGV
jgi:hypothetical protein